MDEYKGALKKDLQETIHYYTKSINKTEQQKMLEKLLEKDDVFQNAQDILDAACGREH